MESTLLSMDRRRWLQMAGAGVAAGFAIPAWLRSQDVAPAPCFEHKDLLVRTPSPPNGEPALPSLMESWITPVKHFYVRSHAPTPTIDTKDFILHVEGLVNESRDFSLLELKEKFASKITTATLTCAGNRRTEYNAMKQVGGVQWQAGAIGNARWTGPLLADILKSVGVRPEAKHVWFEGLDEIEKGDSVIPFGGSIPIDRAMKKDASAPLLAHSMNDKPLAPEHGFPLRSLVPGFIGARSVKWLGKIVVSDRPSPNHYVATAYKLVTESTEKAWQAADPLYGFAINSVLCKPSAADIAKGKTIEIAGYALPTGETGATISRVEISTDGERFQTAELDKTSRPYCWRFWRGKVKISPETEAVWVRAFDSQGGVQPATIDWNLKGYMFNAWHKTAVGS